MRIVISADTYYPNIDGASYFTQRLAKGLIHAGHDVLVIAPGRTLRSGYTTHDGVQIFNVRSVPTFFHKDYRFSLPFFLTALVRPVVKKFKPDVVHIQGHFFVERAVKRAAKQLGIPVMATNHFMPGNLTHYASMSPALEKKLINFMWKDFLRVFRDIPIVTAPTRVAAHVLKDIGLEQDVIPLSCGMNLKEFTPKNNHSYFKKHFKISEPVLLSVCRLAPEKNVDWILRASAEARKKVSFHLVIAGSGTERERLEQLANDLGIASQCTFLGYVSNEDLPLLYASAALFVMAGTIELQSLATMEAMASGLPIIAVDALALPELVRHGENGFLFKPQDIQGMAEDIIRIFSDTELHNKLSHKSLELIKAHDMPHTIAHFEKLYRSLIDR